MLRQGLDLFRHALQVEAAQQEQSHLRVARLAHEGLEEGVQAGDGGVVEGGGQWIKWRRGRVEV